MFPQEESYEAAFQLSQNVMWKNANIITSLHACCHSIVFPSVLLWVLRKLIFILYNGVFSHLISRTNWRWFIFNLPQKNKKHASIVYCSQYATVLHRVTDTAYLCMCVGRGSKHNRRVNMFNITSACKNSWRSCAAPSMVQYCPLLNTFYFSTNEVWILKNLLLHRCPTLICDYTESTGMIQLRQTVTLNLGTKRLNSWCQLLSVEAGEMIRNGPQMLSLCRKNAILLMCLPVKYIFTPIYILLYYIQLAIMHFKFHATTLLTLV